MSSLGEDIIREMVDRDIRFIAEEKIYRGSVYVKFDKPEKSFRKRSRESEEEEEKEVDYVEKKTNPCSRDKVFGRDEIDRLREVSIREYLNNGKKKKVEELRDDRRCSNNSTTQNLRRQIVYWIRKLIQKMLNT